MSCSHPGEPCEHNFSESLHRVEANLPSLQLCLLFVHQQYSICVLFIYLGIANIDKAVRKALELMINYSTLRNAR
jgi:hypothetical protein